MKVTVTFSTVKIVVPCGDGELTVRELTQLATTRYKKATGKPRQSWVSVHSLKAKEGGILDPDDRLVDVCDDREQLIAFYDEEGIPQGGDGMSASSDESETTSGFGKTDVEVGNSEYGGGGILQVRRGSEPALNKLQHQQGLTGMGSTDSVGSYDDPGKRWGNTMGNRDIVSSKNDLSVIDEASFYSESNCDSAGKLSPLPPPFERGRGSGAARDSDRPTPFSRDSNRLSIQICHEDGRWLEAAERASQMYSSHPDHQQSLDSPEVPPHPTSTAKPHGIRQRAIDAKIELFENASSLRKEPLGGISPPHISKPNDRLTRVVIQNEIGPLGIHVVPSGDPSNPGLVIQGIEPGGRIDRDGRLAVHDRIVEINGYSLTDLPFNKAQEIFKEALFAKELKLVVEKCESPSQDQMMASDYFLSDENKENIDNENESLGTLGRRFGSGAGSKLTSSVQAANTRKIGKKIVINLVKGVNGLGFSITTRDIQSGGVTPIYIKHILPKGAAIENGQLKPGDRLLEINGQSVDGKSQSDVVAVLRNIPPNGEVGLVVSRQEIVEEMEHNTLDHRKERAAGGGSASNNNSVLVESSSGSNSTVPNSEESEEFSSISPDLQVNHNGEVVFPWKHREILTLDIPVHDTERAGLGVSVKGKTTGGGSKGIVDLGIFVKNVINGGAASRDGRLKTNDQLVNINGISLLGKANCDAMDTLRRAMHEEGPTPGVITLTVARRLNLGPGGELTARLKATGRDSVTSMLTSSSGDDSYREYRIGHDGSKHSMNNSSLTDTSTTSQNETVIYVEKPRMPPPPPPAFDNFIAPAIPRNPVVDRLMGRKDRQVDMGLRNESYYRATGHDTWNATMLQQLDTTDSGPGKLQSPTVHQGSGETVMIEQSNAELLAAKSRMGERPHSPDGCEGQNGPANQVLDNDAAYASQTSLEEPASFTFARDQPGRQSMSEKRHATLDAKSTDTYQRSKRARQEREKGPMLGMKKSSSLESLQTMMTEMKMESGRQASRVKTSRVVRGRGCNESFRAAVDRSYEAQDPEDQPDAEIMETFDRADYRQSGSSLDSNNDYKKKKNAKIFKGFGMFKFGKQRAKSTDAMRHTQDRKTPTPESNSCRQTPTTELDSGQSSAAAAALRREEEREKMLHEQAKIQQHYRRLLQQRQQQQQLQQKDNPAGGGGGGEVVAGLGPHQAPPQIILPGGGGLVSQYDKERTDEVYSGEGAGSSGGNNNLPASLVAARPGSGTGITGTPTDPRFANYEEIQRHLSRRQAQYHSQRREHPSRSDRPVSNFYEYESVQSAISHGRQHSSGSTSSSGFPHSQSGLPANFHNANFSPPRHNPAPRRDPRQQQFVNRSHRPPDGLSVAPLPAKYGQFSGRGDYDEYGRQPPPPSQHDLPPEDPYSRVMYQPDRNRTNRVSHPNLKQSQSGSRIQSHQVPKNNVYVPSLPPGSKV